MKQLVVLSGGARSIREAAQEILSEAPADFAILGFSLGGIIAAEITLRAPERVRGLALLQTTPLSVAPQHHASRYAAVREARAVGLARYVRERLWPEYRGWNTSDTFLPLLEEMAESTGIDAFSRQVEMAITREDYRERLTEVKCPTLVLSGEADKLCPAEAHAALKQALPESVSVVMPGAGHLALLERPDEVAAHVAAWFHTVEQRRQA